MVGGEGEGEGGREREGEGGREGKCVYALTQQCTSVPLVTNLSPFEAKISQTWQ